MAPVQHLPSLTSILLAGAASDETMRDMLAAGATSPVNPTQLALLAGGVVVLLFIATRNRLGRLSNGKSITKSDHRRGQAVDDRTLREVEAVMAQLDQLSRQIHGKIDLKLVTLQKVIRDADQRIDQLSRLQRGVQGEATLDIELESEIPNRPVEDNESPQDAVYRLADSGYTPLQIAKQLARHTGEVELILSLRRAKHAPSFGSAGTRKQPS
jgi:hypothetical protein